MPSPRTNHRMKVAREAGLYVSDLYLVNDEWLPIVTSEDFVKARGMNAEIRFGVSCNKDDVGATLDLNAGERILRGISTPELERLHRRSKEV